MPMSPVMVLTVTKGSSNRSLSRAMIAMLAKQVGLTINAFIRKTLEEKAESELVV